MDLYAYAQIEKYSKIAEENGIEVPRLRGYRLMVEEDRAFSDDDDSIPAQTFNKYVGRNDVLCIHARIGGGNWDDYRDEVENEPWFIEKVDDDFDPTYCDIYARIKPIGD